jgi:hypothetical protein
MGTHVVGLGTHCILQFDQGTAVIPCGDMLLRASYAFICVDEPVATAELYAAGDYDESCKETQALGHERKSLSGQCIEVRRICQILQFGARRIAIGQAWRAQRDDTRNWAADYG